MHKKLRRPSQYSGQHKSLLLFLPLRSHTKRNLDSYLVLKICQSTFTLPFLPIGFRKQINIPLVVDLTHLARSLKSKEHSLKQCTQLHLEASIHRNASKALQWHAIQEIQVPQIRTHDLHQELTKDFLFLQPKDRIFTCQAIQIQSEKLKQKRTQIMDSVKQLKLNMQS